MTIRATFSRVFSTAFTSGTIREVKRAIFRGRRGNKPGLIHYFHQVDDPYSHLAAQILPEIVDRYRVQIVPHLVLPPSDEAAPERERLKGYARRDAMRLCIRYGLTFPDVASDLNAEAISSANAQMAYAISQGTFIDSASSIGEVLWRGGIGNVPSLADDDTRIMMEEGDRLRRNLGHYLGGMFYFDGEWYWGIDRLHHLETRLRSENLVRDPESLRIAPYQDALLDGRSARGVKPVIEFWFSFRSPYSYIAAARLHKLASHYGAEVRWRFIFPMVMRGLPVPRDKTRYIMLDVKREAELHKIPYGTMVDPRGEGVRRALAVLHRAIQMGKGAAFAESGLAAAFADGIDMASDRGLLRAASRAGIDEIEVRKALADESWRLIAEENRKALLDAGLWGAPTYRVNGGPAHWGQDRLWMIEDDLKLAISRS